MYTIIAAAVLACAVIISVNALGIYIARQFCYPKTWSMEETFSKSMDYGDFTEEYVSSLDFIPLRFTSTFGYELSGVYVIPKKDPVGTVLLCHGHRYTWHGMIKYLQLFLNMGFRVVTYNHRYHGDTGGENCSAGYFEKHDLHRAAAWVRQRFGESGLLGLMGESMGAATVLQYLDLGDQPDFVIADCPYSSMEDIYRHQLKAHHIPRVFHTPIIRAARRYLGRSAGIPLNSVSPKRSVRGTSVPILLIHGDADSYVPPYMSAHIRESLPKDHPSKLVLVEGAGHAQSWKTSPGAYEQLIRDFVLPLICAKHQYDMSSP